MASEREEGYMQQHLCECMIDIAGEKTNVQRRGPTDPVPWPEIKVLQEVHGDQSIYDIRPVALGPRDTGLREKERMSLIYGRDAVEKVYAGKSFQMEFFMPGWPIDPAQAGKKPDKNARAPKVQMHAPNEDELI